MFLGKYPLNRVKRVVKTILMEGVLVGYKFILAEFFNKNVKIKFRGYKYPVFIRANTCDSLSAYFVFIEEEYKVFEDRSFDVVFDLGANAGYAAVYFAHHYPDSKIVCLEPDVDNFEQLRKNTSFYSNVSTIQRGVWWRQANIKVENPHGDSWSYRFKEANGEGVLSLPIDDLISKYSEYGSIMVKMDIEGAEKEIFSNCSDWISKASVIQIEIHDCWKEVFDRLSSHKYKCEISGENVIISFEE